MIFIEPVTQVGFEQESYTVNEEDGTVAVRLYRAGPQLRKPVIMRLSSAGGSATGMYVACAHNICNMLMTSFEVRDFTHMNCIISP